MDYVSLHDFSCTESEMKDIQLSLSKSVQQDVNVKNPQVISGVDISYMPHSQCAVCCMVTMDLHDLSILETIYHVADVDIPYMPGYLSFRELPLFLGVWEKATIRPDIVFFDGNGILHPRGLGLASHASFFIGTPTIGVAKTPTVAYAMPHMDKGSMSNILMEGEKRGVALRTQKGVKPIFVSTGNLVPLDQAVELVLQLSRPDGVIMSQPSRIPAITRIPDILSREYIRKHLR